MDRMESPEAVRRRVIATIGAALGASALPAALRAQQAPAFDTVRTGVREPDRRDPADRSAIEGHRRGRRRGCGLPW